jgi:hypothetical protein
LPKNRPAESSQNPRETINLIPIRKH